MIENEGKQEPPFCQRSPGCVGYWVWYKERCNPRFLCYSAFRYRISFLISCGRRSLLFLRLHIPILSANLSYECNISDTEFLFLRQTPSLYFLSMYFLLVSALTAVVVSCSTTRILVNVNIHREYIANNTIFPPDSFVLLQV